MLPSYHVWNTSSPPRCVMLGELIFWSLINLVLDPFLCRSKTNSSESPYWLLGKEAKKIVSPTHIFVFVALRAGEPKVSFYVVPRPFVAEHTYEEHFRNGTWYSFTKADAAPFENKWLEHFGPPQRVNRRNGGDRMLATCRSSIRLSGQILAPSLALGRCGLLPSSTVHPNVAAIDSHQTTNTRSEHGDVPPIIGQKNQTPSALAPWVDLVAGQRRATVLPPSGPPVRSSLRAALPWRDHRVRQARAGSRGAQYSAVARRLPRQKRAYLLHRDRHTNRRREGPPRLAAQIQRRNSPFFNRKASGPNSHGGSTCRSLLIFRRDHP